jgi:hypothetical protein
VTFELLCVTRIRNSNWCESRPISGTLDAVNYKSQCSDFGASWHVFERNCAARARRIRTAMLSDILFCVILWGEGRRNMDQRLSLITLGVADLDRSRTFL